MTTEQIKKLQDLIDHLDDFWASAKKLAFKLISEGEVNTARLLLAHAKEHDRSKLYGLEWDCLVMGERQDLLKTAVQNHNRSNSHHPECWGGIDQMPDVFVAEMVCDWKARSVKFGTSLKDWINNEATDKYQFNKSDPVYSKIMKFVSLLLDEPYKRLDK